jgi:hypothetical protein
MPAIVTSGADSLEETLLEVPVSAVPPKLTVVSDAPRTVSALLMVAAVIVLVAVASVLFIYLDSVSASATGWVFVPIGFICGSFVALVKAAANCFTACCSKTEPSVISFRPASKTIRLTYPRHCCEVNESVREVVPL